jgi:hypothetical protein
LDGSDIKYLISGRNTTMQSSDDSHVSADHSSDSHQDLALDSNTISMGGGVLHSQDTLDDYASLQDEVAGGESETKHEVIDTEEKEHTGTTPEPTEGEAVAIRSTSTSSKSKSIPRAGGSQYASSRGSKTLHLSDHSSTRSGRKSSAQRKKDRKARRKGKESRQLGTSSSSTHSDLRP